MKVTKLYTLDEEDIFNLVKVYFESKNIKIKEPKIIIKKTPSEWTYDGEFYDKKVYIEAEVDGIVS